MPGGGGRKKERKRKKEGKEKGKLEEREGSKRWVDGRGRRKGSGSLMEAGGGGA